MRKSRIDHVIDSICNRGCRYVNTILTDKKAQQGCRELVKLSREEQSTVFKELKSVMSVYDQTGSCGI